MENAALEKVHNLENDKDYIFNIQTFNKIAPAGLDVLATDNFNVSDANEQADAYLLRSQSLHDHDFPQTLKAIGRAGAGVNNIPVDRCTQSGVIVFNAPGANANAVKELAIVGMLLASRDIVGGIDYVKSIADDPNISSLVEKNKSKFKGFELIGKRLGVIGLGAIGLQVANAGLALGMDVAGYDPFISVRSAWDLSSHVTRLDSLERLIQESDVLSVHVPYTENTKGFINKERIELMKPGAIVLNLSRDALVDEAAMTAALDAGTVHRYVSDFPNPLLVNHPSVISIPHLGASTDEAEVNCAVMVSKQVKQFLKHGTIENSVNFPTIMLERSTPFRITVVNHNVPSIIGQITSILAEKELNISEMVNKSRGDMAYTIIDLDSFVDQETIEQLLSLDGVVRVRQLPPLS
tara:strand:- start:1248 stop:2474 length:1227 start_codon:yes stop_codon:yes gene_type:complete